MSWNIAPECISLVMLCIIWWYSHMGSFVPSLKNRFFQYCFLVTFCAMLSNVLSTVMIQHYTVVPVWLNWFVAFIYFICTPLMGTVYFFYSATVIFERSRHMVKVCLWGSILAVVYIILVLLTPLTQKVFYFTQTGSYVQGEWLVSTYLVFYTYCIASLVMALTCRRWIDKSVYRILVSFPVIALLVILFQQMFPHIILSGTAATCALLMIYLNLQNRQISIDYLTNLPNRQEFLNMITLLLKKQEKESFTIAVVSLREFKQVNNACGQNNGDLFLKEISQYLLELVKPRRIYRFNGDEFAILLRDNQEETIRNILFSICDRMAMPWKIKGYTCMIPVAIGVAHYPMSSQNLEGLITGLEYAVAKAKKDIEVGMCFCGDKMLKEILRKRQIVEILKQKCETDSFEIYYQPIIDVKTGCFLYVESLMRIMDSEVGPIYPNEFIPIAEETGVIIELTYHILDRVCKFVNHLDQKGIDIRRVHVNFSAIQFKELGLIDKVCSVITENNTPFSKIKIEFTESTIVEDPLTVECFVNDMREKGIGMGLDDFGTGYSNLDSVIHIPFDTIKLDKSLIWSAMNHKKSAIMVKNMTKTFHDLGMKVLAEGVETKEQNDFVVDCGMEMIQGFLYAKPLSENEVEKFLKENQEISRSI